MKLHLLQVNFVLGPLPAHTSNLTNTIYYYKPPISFFKNTWSKWPNSSNISNCTKMKHHSKPKIPKKKIAWPNLATVLSSLGTIASFQKGQRGRVLRVVPTRDVNGARWRGEYFPTPCPCPLATPRPRYLSGEIFSPILVPAVPMGPQFFLKKILVLNSNINKFQKDLKSLTNIIFKLE